MKVFYENEGDKTPKESESLETMYQKILKAMKNRTQKVEPENTDPPKGFPSFDAAIQSGYLPYNWQYKDRKLMIVLLESTVEVAKEKETIEKIIGSLLGFTATDYICMLYYGNGVHQGEIRETGVFDRQEILPKEEIGNNSCLWEALVALEKLVQENYEKKQEFNKKFIRFKKIEIIGIGSCRHDGSNVSRQLGMEKFAQIAKLPNVTSKFFCFSEENFMEAARIGFRSIGAINRESR